MKKTKSAICLLVLMITSVLRFGYISASADGSYAGAQFFSDGKGGFYIFLKDDKISRLFFCSKSSDVHEINCEKFAAEDVIYDNGNIYLTRYMDHTFCIFDVKHQDNILIESFPIKQGFIIKSDNKFYACDEENPDQVKVYKGSNLISTIKTRDNILGLFSDHIQKTVYAAVNDGVVCADVGRFIKCTVPVFPITYNEGIYTDSVGDMYSFDNDSGFELIFSTDSRYACYSNGFAYYEKDGVIIRTEIENKNEAIYEPEKDIISLSASGSYIAVLTEDEVLNISDKFYTPEKEVSEDYYSEESYAAEKTESSKETDKQRSQTNPKKEISDMSEPEKTKKYEVLSESLDGKVISIPNETTAAAFRKSLNNSSAVRFRNSSGTVVDKGTIGTGWQIEITVEGISKNYTVVIYGDINGNGTINTADAGMISEYLCERCELNDAQKYAADMNKDGVIDIRDICRFQEVYYSNGKSIPRNAIM